jgi:hypothetical protein
MTAMHELVVPKSIPITFGIKILPAFQRSIASNPSATVQFPLQVVDNTDVMYY